MKKMRILLFVTILALIFTNCKDEKNNKVKIIPEPVKVSYNKGTFHLNKYTNLCYFNIDTNSSTIQYIKEYFPKLLNINLNINNSRSCSNNHICFEILPKYKEILGEEGYDLHVDRKHISIQANTYAGIFYGFQTLFLLAPDDACTKIYKSINIPCVDIIDYPRFKWRGSHLDVCRHFFDIEFIKKHLDMLAIHKINKFHWHLTDDHGWRIQIDKYPKLTEIGAWRVDRSNVPWTEGQAPQQGEKSTYGGYYTKEQMKEVVAYAAQRHIDIIPEIELPGHSAAILAAYPEFGCNNEEYYVQIGPYWPPSAILCAGNDKTMQFLYDVIDEVAEIFPYEYIHIGGDEAFKDNWKICSKCKARMKKLKITDYEALQGWMVICVEKHINSLGKKMIGWDEILDGGVTKNATIMSWRDREGGEKAAKQGNFAIMCPTTYCYLDYYQADPSTQPIAIGGYVPLRKVYSLEPVPENLSPKESNFILGTQGNLWTEFINTPEHAEYMLWPRLSAISEVAWSQKNNKNWDRFKDKVEITKNRLNNLNYNYCEGNFSPIISTEYKNENLYVSLSSDVKGVKLYYTLDNTEPTIKSNKYLSPMLVTDSVIVKARSYYKGNLKGITSATVIYPNKLAGKKINVNVLPSEKYNACGIYSLCDGIRGSNYHTDGRWLGFQTDKITVIIENNGTELNEITIRNNVNHKAWIFAPLSISVSISNTGKTYEQKLSLNNDYPIKTEEPFINQSVLRFDKTVKPKYVKIEITGINTLPSWHDYAGSKAWIFIDEIIFN